MAPKKSTTQPKSQTPQPPATRSGGGTKSCLTSRIDDFPEVPEDYEQILRYVAFKFEQRFDEFRSELIREMNKKDEKISELDKQILTLNRE